MKKQTEWTCGNVNVKAILTLPDNTAEGIATMALDGLTQILQRKPSSAWEKAEAGYDKRPEGFKRNSIAYSAASAEKLEELFTDALPSGVQVEFTMSEHVGGEDASPKLMATAMWAKVKDDDAMRAALGADEDTSDDEGIALAHAFLGTLRKPRK